MPPNTQIYICEYKSKVPERKAERNILCIFFKILLLQAINLDSDTKE